MKKIKKPQWIALLCVCILVIIGAVIFLIRYFNQPDINGEVLPTTAATRDETRKDVRDETTASEQPSEAESTEHTYTGAPVVWGYQPAVLDDYQPSFDELMDINPDIYAWIYIPNTAVDYPVARSTSDGDDSFYLEHNVYRQYQFSGTIYSEIKNSPDMHDKVTVMYGHNMLNGTMFATLHNFGNKEFFEENNTAFVLTKDKIFTYLIYSAYTYDDRHILNTNNFGNDEVFQSYLDETLDPHAVDANVREGVTLTTDNRILTLSTCTSGPSDTRYLVQGVLVDEARR